MQLHNPQRRHAVGEPSDFKSLFVPVVTCRKGHQMHKLSEISVEFDTVSHCRDPLLQLSCDTDYTVKLDLRDSNYIMYTPS